MNLGKRPRIPKSCKSFRDAILPGCVVRFFEIEKDCDDMLSFNEGIADIRFKSDQMILGASSVSDATMIISDEVV